jgi:hypothetical protein
MVYLSISAIIFIIPLAIKIEAGISSLLLGNGLENL